MDSAFAKLRDHHDTIKDYKKRRGVLLRSADRGIVRPDEPPKDNAKLRKLLQSKSPISRRYVAQNNSSRFDGPNAGELQVIALHLNRWDVVL